MKLLPLRKLCLSQGQLDTSNHANNHLVSPSGPTPFARLCRRTISSRHRSCHAHKSSQILGISSFSQYRYLRCIWKKSTNSTPFTPAVTLRSFHLCFFYGLSHHLCHMHTVLKHLRILSLKKNSLFDGQLKFILASKKILSLCSTPAY